MKVKQSDQLKCFHAHSLMVDAMSTLCSLPRALSSTCLSAIQLSLASHKQKTAQRKTRRVTMAIIVPSQL